MRKLLPNFLMLFASICIIGMSSADLSAQTPMYHNNPTGGGNTIPFYYTGLGCRGQQLYPVGVFGSPTAGQAITTIYFKPGATSNGTQTYTNFEVSLKQANISVLTTTYETGMTPVFVATGHTITYVGDQWFAIKLQNPFPYDPTLPLIWEVNQLTSGGSSWSMQTAPTVSGAYRSYAPSYNAVTASAAGAYQLNFGFDLAPIATAENDAGVSKIDSPNVFCPGLQNIVATVRNYGINQITSVVVNWEFKGILQPPVLLNTIIDTFNGAGLNEVQVLLGSKPFSSGVIDNITAWTSLPNNKVDTAIKNDTATALVQPSLSGVFTVNPAGSGPKNYLTISDAIDNMLTLGVCGSVTFQVSPGIYNEQLDFRKIPGASSINTVTFKADTSNGGVIVEYGAAGTGDNFVCVWNGVEWVTIDGFQFRTTTAGSVSYKRLFTVSGGASNNTLINCTLTGYNNTSSSVNYHTLYCSGAGHNYNKFINNTFDANNGYYGVYYYGGSTSAPSIGNEFIGNKFLNASEYSTYFYYQEDLKFNYNEVTSPVTTNSYGLRSYYSYGSAEVIGNHIYGINDYSMYLYYHEGSPNKFAIIANNWITAGTGGTATVYGIYMSTPVYAKIVNNTVWKNNTGGTYGIYMTSGYFNDVYNNMVYAPNGTATSYGMYIGTTNSVSNMDHNNVFTNGYYGYFGSIMSNLNAWKNGGGGANSYDFDPAYSTVDSLRHCNDSLDNTGIALEYLTTDIDQDLRSLLTPDIGADEFIGSDSSSYSAGPDRELCNGMPITIGSPVSGATFQWSTGATTPTIEVNSTGSYTVLVNSSCGGALTDVVSVTDITPTSSFTFVESYLGGTFTNTSTGPDATYSWAINIGGVIDTVWKRDLNYSFPGNGPYEVCLTTYNKCDTVSSCQMWQGTVGISNTRLDRRINMFPNPASNNVSIQFNELIGDNLSIELINIQGQVVYSKNLVDINGNGTETIDVSSLDGGMYLVRFITDNDIATKQLIVR